MGVTTNLAAIDEFLIRAAREESQDRNRRAVDRLIESCCSGYGRYPSSFDRAIMEECGVASRDVTVIRNENTHCVYYCGCVGLKQKDDIGLTAYTPMLTPNNVRIARWMHEQGIEMSEDIRVLIGDDLTADSTVVAWIDEPEFEPEPADVRRSSGSCFLPRRQQ